MYCRFVSGGKKEESGKGKNRGTPLTKPGFHFPSFTTAAAEAVASSSSSSGGELCLKRGRERKVEESSMDPVPTLFPDQERRREEVKWTNCILNSFIKRTGFYHSTSIQRTYPPSLTHSLSSPSLLPSFRFLLFAGSAFHCTTFILVSLGSHHHEIKWKRMNKREGESDGERETVLRRGNACVLMEGGKGSLEPDQIKSFSSFHSLSPFLNDMDKCHQQQHSNDSEETSLTQNGEKKKEWSERRKEERREGEMSKCIFFMNVSWGHLYSLPSSLAICLFTFPLFHSLPLSPSSPLSDEEEEEEKMKERHWRKDPSTRLIGLIGSIHDPGSFNLTSPLFSSSSPIIILIILICLYSRKGNRERSAKVPGVGWRRWENLVTDSWHVGHGTM